MNDPKELHCDAVLEALNAFIDGELDESDADEIRVHLAACELCMDDLDVRAAIRTVLQRCCCETRAPETLRMRVVTQITVARSVHWQI